MLEPWPHLVKLFTELLSEKDCLEAGAVSPCTHTHTRAGVWAYANTHTYSHTVQLGERMEVTNVREFAVQLKVTLQRMLNKCLYSANRSGLGAPPLDCPPYWIS